MAYLGRRGALAPVTSADIPDNSITAAKIVADTIAAGDIADDAVGTAELANDVVISTTGAITTTGGLTVEENLASDTQTTPETVASFGAKASSNGSDLSPGSGARLELKIPSDDSPYAVTGAGIASIKELGNEVNSSSALAFYTSQNDTTLDEFMRIDSSGNVGVGTDAPTATISSYKVYSGTANTVDNMTLAVASDGAVNTRSEIGFGKQVAGSYSPSSISYVTDDATSFSKGHFEFALRDATTDSAATMHLQIDSDGDVTVNTGDLVIGAVGKGIDFSNAADTAAGETIGTRGSVLDDYEEGTFTATLSNYAGGNPSTTQNIPGYYVKIGNLVQIDISGWSLDAGGASGQVVVAGIPFTSSNPGSDRAFHGQCGLMRNICTIPTGTTLITDPMPRLAKNSAIVFIYANRVDSSNYAAVNYKGGTMSNGVLEFSIAYEAL